MRIRTLGQLWNISEGDPRPPEQAAAEKQFVELLLVNLANGNTVRNSTWRKAEELWEHTVHDQIDLKKANPEVIAMYLLTAQTTAGTDVEGLIRPYYTPGP